MHPPKVETFDVPAGTNTDPKGIVRSVDTYRREPFGLYLSRPMPDHPSLAWLQSWLLPDLGLRITDFRFRPGHGRDQDFYLDVVEVRRVGEIWWTVDHYLDIVVRTGRDSRVLDIDEFAAAVAEGLLEPAAAEHALLSSHRAVAGLAGHGHDVDAWLGALGFRLRWQRPD